MTELTPEKLDAAVLALEQKSIEEWARKHPDRAAKWGRVADADSAWSSVSYQREPFELPGVGWVEVVDYFNEEFSTDHYVVVKVTDSGNRQWFFKRCGWRRSHDGSYLDGPTVPVRAETKTVTVWEELR